MPVCNCSYCPKGAVHFNGAEMCQTCDLKGHLNSNSDLEQLQKFCTWPEGTFKSHLSPISWRNLVFSQFRVRYLLHQGREVQGGLGAQEGQAVQGFHHCQEGREDPV